MLFFKNNIRLLSSALIGRPVTIIFVFLCVIGIKLSGLTLLFITEEVLTRLSRDTVLALALLPPIAAGMGINFALPAGAIATQSALLTAICLGLKGTSVIVMAISTAMPLAIFLGWGIGIILNRVKGREMIVSIVIGLIAANFYQLLCLGIPGKIISVANTSVLLSKGSGLRNSVDLDMLKHLLKNLWKFNIGGLEVSLGALIVVACFAIAVHLLLKTRFGLHARAVADDKERAALCGIAPNNIRIQAMIISTLLAACGQFIYLQDLSILNVYTGHMMLDIFASAALFAGGATLNRASVPQVLLGIVLFHTLFVVSPLAGQNTFSNSALGEYFRSFVAYGVIALAILVNNSPKPLKSNFAEIVKPDIKLEKLK